MSEQNPTSIETEVETQQAMTHPGSQASVDDLALLDRDRSREVVAARIEILDTLRKASIRITSPEDWLLFRSLDSRITGYLQDCGCERIRPLWGIDITPTGTQRVPMEDSQFMYIVTGNGYSNVTKKSVTGMEGARCSTDDFTVAKSGAQCEMAVRKAARANLDGGIVRELTGLSNVPVEELIDAWKGTNKKWEHCRFGRGFGSQAERMGATKTSGEYGEAPKCPKCKTVMKFFTGKDGREPFWGCPNYKDCGQKPITAKKQTKTPQDELGDTEAPSEGERSNGAAQESDNKKESIGDIKNRLMRKIKTLPVEERKTFTASLTSTKDIDQLLDLEIAINERLAISEGGAN